jgi:hypothetical protein
MAEKEETTKLTRLTNVATGVVVNVDSDTAETLGGGWATDANYDAAKAEFDAQQEAERAAAEQAEADRVAAAEKAEKEAKAAAERDAEAKAKAAAGTEAERNAAAQKQAAASAKSGGSK